MKPFKVLEDRLKKENAKVIVRLHEMKGVRKYWQFTQFARCAPKDATNLSCFKNEVFLYML